MIILRIEKLGPSWIPGLPMAVILYIIQQCPTQLFLMETQQGKHSPTTAGYESQANALH